jgi:hypothetical protein
VNESTLNLLRIFAVWVAIPAVVVSLALEGWYSGRFGNDYGPMPTRLRLVLLWIIFIGMLAMMAWSFKHNIVS